MGRASQPAPALALMWFRKEIVVWKIWGGPKILKSGGVSLFRQEIWLSLKMWGQDWRKQHPFPQIRLKGIEFSRGTGNDAGEPR